MTDTQASLSSPNDKNIPVTVPHVQHLPDPDSRLCGLLGTSDGSGFAFLASPVNPQQLPATPDPHRTRHLKLARIEINSPAQSVSLS